MLRITAVGAGAVDYLLRGSGCAEHEHGPQRDAGAEPGREQTGRARPGADGREPGAHGSGARRGTSGRRWSTASRRAGGAGAGWRACSGPHGIEVGGQASEDVVRSVFGRLQDPTSGESLGPGAAQVQGHRGAGGGGAGRGRAGRDPGAAAGGRAGRGRGWPPGGGVLRPDVLPGQSGVGVLRGAAGRGRCGGGGGGGRGARPGGREWRWPTPRSTSPTPAPAITAAPPTGGRWGGTRRARGWCGRGGGTRPTGSPSRSCTPTSGCSTGCGRGRTG